MRLSDRGEQAVELERAERSDRRVRFERMFDRMFDGTFGRTSDGMFDRCAASDADAVVSAVRYRLNDADQTAAGATVSAMTWLGMLGDTPVPFFSSPSNPSARADDERADLEAYLKARLGPRPFRWRRLRCRSSPPTAVR